MQLSIALFPGAMGPEGFISCFSQLIDEKDLRRMIVLKGGPGVGKSTFMRRVHAALAAHDEDSTLCFCSGDPDSLDAVVLPNRGVLILDGTAPHTIDPIYPGARDSIVNLGACLDEAAMRPRLGHIRACMEDHAACSRRARACMQAAWALHRDNAALAASCMDEARIARITAALLSSTMDEAATSGTGKVRRVITDAVTPKGRLCLLTEKTQSRVIRLTGHFAMDFTPALQALSRAARAAGFDVWEHLSPMSPGSLLHITIPGLSTLVTTSDTLAAEQTFDFASCHRPGSLLRHESALEQARSAAARHTQSAVNALAQAKTLHDELETFYVPNMDFAKWQTMLDETLQSLRA